MVIRKLTQTEKELLITGLEAYECDIKHIAKLAAPLKIKLEIDLIKIKEFKAMLKKYSTVITFTEK